MSRSFSRFKIGLVSIITCLHLTVSWSQNDYLYTPDQLHWADSVLGTLSVEEKIGQLFMVAAYSNQGRQHEQAIETLITRYHIGGLIFFQGDPEEQIRLTNQYQAISRVPLLIGMDLEWGLGMRLDNTISFPRQMTLGAIQEGLDTGNRAVVEVWSRGPDPVQGWRDIAGRRRRPGDFTVE